MLMILENIGSSLIKYKDSLFLPCNILPPPSCLYKVLNLYASKKKIISNLAAASHSLGP